MVTINLQTKLEKSATSNGLELCVYRFYIRIIQLDYYTRFYKEVPYCRAPSY